MMLTRQHFYEVARILRSFRDKIQPVVYTQLIDAFCDYFSAQNPRFNPERFKKACRLDHLPAPDQLPPVPLPDHLKDCEILPF